MKLESQDPFIDADHRLALTTVAITKKMELLRDRRHKILMVFTDQV